MSKDKVTYEQIYKFAENSVKVTPSTNSSKLFNELYNKAKKLSNVKELAEKIQDVLYTAALNVLTYEPDTEQETRTKCIDPFVDAIEEVVGVRYREENSNTVRTPKDYKIASSHNGITTVFSIEAKKYASKLFNNKNSVDLIKTRQAISNMAEETNGLGYGVNMVTNGRDIALYMQGYINYKDMKRIRWQPLRDASKPILTLSCYAISKEASVVLAYIIIKTLDGGFNAILESIKNVYNNEVDTLIKRCAENNIEIIERIEYYE